MFRFQKNKYASLIITSNARLENVPTSFVLIKLSNHALQGTAEANSWKNCSKLFQPSEINHVV